MEPDVLLAISEHRKGQSSNYNAMLNELANKEVQEEYVIAVLKQLRNCISELGDCHNLVNVILFNIDWLNRSKRLSQCFQSVVVNLASAHPVYSNLVLKSLVRNFTLAIDADSTNQTLTEEEEAAIVRVIGIIVTITKLLPNSLNLLVVLLSDNTGHVSHPVRRQLSVCRALLQLGQCLPTIRKQLLKLLVDKLIQIDVRAPREDIAQSLEDSDTEEEVFDMESDGIPDRCEPGMKHEMANKLDLLMALVLQYVKDSCYSQDRLDWTATRCLYKELLSVFDSQILATYNCCHVQFILFVICSYHESLAEGFVDYLWKQVQKPGQPVFRQRSAAYLGGFLARANYINIETLAVSLELQSQWCHSYVAAAHSPPELALHAPFYMVCQNLFYVFVFHHQKLLESKRGLKFVMSLNLQSLVTCRLNPLKYCLPAVAKTFASLARQHQIAFCDTVLEHNARCQVPVAQDSSGCTYTRLEPFFPFDPYMLQRSGEYISHLYTDFTGQPVVEPEPEEHEIDDMDFLEETSDDEERLQKGLLSPGSVPKDLILHGTSPGFTLQ